MALLFTLILADKNTFPDIMCVITFTNNANQTMVMIRPKSMIEFFRGFWSGRDITVLDLDDGKSINKLREN